RTRTARPRSGRPSWPGRSTGSRRSPRDAWRRSTAARRREREAFAREPALPYAGPATMTPADEMERLRAPDTIEVLARAMHENYVREQRAKGDGPASNPLPVSADAADGHPP